MEDAPEFFYAGDTLRSTSRSGRMGHAGLYVPHLSLSFHAFASMFCISANPQCGNNSSGARQNGWNHPGPASDNGVIVDDRPNCSLPNATEILTPGVAPKRTSGFTVRVWNGLSSANADPQ